MSSLDSQSLETMGLASSLNYAIFGIAGMIANATLLVALFRTRNEAPPYNKTLASLAIANFISDVFFATIGTMFSYDIKTGNLPFQQWEDTFELLFINKGIIIIALSHIVFIAIQRFIAVHFPFRFRRIFTTKLTWFYISLTWLIAISIFLLSWHIDSNNIFAKDRLVSYTILVFVFTLIVCYTWILISLRIQRRVSRQLRSSNNATSDTEHSMKLLLNSVGVTLLFLILVCPYAISSLKGDNFIMRYLLSSLVPVRTVIDPLVYFFISICIKCSRSVVVQKKNDNNSPMELVGGTAVMDSSKGPGGKNLSDI